MLDCSNRSGAEHQPKATTSMFQRSMLVRRKEQGQQPKVDRSQSRARRFPQENAAKQTRVGVSATYTYDLKTEYGICNQDPYFDFSEKWMQ